jgi:hypothetical protein
MFSVNSSISALKCLKSSLSIYGHILVKMLNSASKCLNQHIYLLVKMLNFSFETHKAAFLHIYLLVKMLEVTFQTLIAA